MLRVVEEFHRTDVGRQRTGNEDNLFVRSPLFVVADGMGGAQAGEVASKMAVDAFERGLPDGDPGAALEGLIQEANARIHSLSRESTERAGMGTTLTAAYFAEDDHVVIGHVGDSRCYLWRDGELTRLTRDHSLVGELVARGRLTEEQAEVHPQRSVITRALGPEPQVRVDREAFEARDGDVFLLCSDGLTTMLNEGQVRQILEIEAPLEELGQGLVDAANQAGGKDNITVILFRLAALETAGPAEADDAPTESGESAPRTDDIAAAVAEAERAEALAPATTPPPRRAPLPADDITVVHSAAAAPAAERKRRRFPTGALVALVIAAMILAGGWIASRAVYFLGTDDDARTIAIYRGLPYELPLGIELYERVTGSGVTLDSVPVRRRSLFTDHKLRSRDDAEDLVVAAEKGRLEQ